MFYLTTHSTHFIYGYKEGNILFNDALNTFYFTVIWKEGNVLFNDALNTFYLRLYGRKEVNILFNDALNKFYLRLYGRKEILYLRRTQHILFTVIWRQTYGKGPLRQLERKPATATLATLSD